MEYLKLGNSDLTVSRIGFGCDQMGMHNWGDLNERDLLKAVSVAMDMGTTLFDTADIYGLGTSERMLAKALGKRRTDVVISTKFGVRRSPEAVTYYENSEPWLRKAIEQTLVRLNTDYIDIYHIHYWDGVTPLEQTFEILEKFRGEGKIRYFGISNIHTAELPLKKIPPGLVSFTLEYSLATRTWEHVIRSTIGLYGLSFFSWGSLAQGLLSGKYDQESIFPANDRRRRKVYQNFHGDRLTRNLEMLKKMRAVLEEYPGRTMAQMAIRWILDYVSESVVLVGAKTPDQAADNCLAGEWSLGPIDVQRLDRISK